MSVPPKKFRSKICLYHLGKKGTNGCKFGANCNFLHPDVHPAPIVPVGKEVDADPMYLKQCSYINPTLSSGSCTSTSSDCTESMLIEEYSDSASSCGVDDRDEMHDEALSKLNPGYEQNLFCYDIAPIFLGSRSHEQQQLLSSAW